MSMHHIISLGIQCHTSLALKEMGHKHYSAPFDWIFSNLDMIIHMLQDDFQTFLDRSQMFSVKASTGGHRAYKACASHEVIFNHHNPAANDSDYAYFVRCVERFRNALLSNEPVKFVLTLHQDGEQCGLSTEAVNVKLDTIYQLLKARCANMQMMAVVFSQEKSNQQTEFNKVEYEESSETHPMIVRLSTKSDYTGWRFGHPPTEQLYRDILLKFVK